MSVAVQVMLLKEVRRALGILSRVVDLALAALDPSVKQLEDKRAERRRLLT